MKTGSAVSPSAGNDSTARVDAGRVCCESGDSHVIKATVPVASHPLVANDPLAAMFSRCLRSLSKEGHANRPLIAI